MDYKAQGIVVLALGGYGRRELCLKSDIDIMILHKENKSNQAKNLAEKLLYKLWDTGLEVGNSLRTIDECLELASMQDSSILSSMMDLRAISGDSNFYIELKNKLNKSLLPNISQNFINEDNNVKILMTLTSPNCPVAETLPVEVEEKVKSLDEIKDVQVEITFDPPWTQDLISEEAKLELGML